MILILLSLIISNIKKFFVQSIVETTPQNEARKFIQHFQTATFKSHIEKIAILVSIYYPFDMLWTIYRGFFLCGIPDSHPL